MNDNKLNTMLCYIESLTTEELTYLLEYTINEINSRKAEQDRT